MALNPMRPEIEQVLFKTDLDVIIMLKNMEDSLAIITEMQTSDDPNKDQVIATNTAYINGCMQFQTLQTFSIDFSRYVI